MSTGMEVNMEEQQPPAKKSRMGDPSSSKEESTEIVIQNDGAMESKNALLEAKMEMLEDKLEKQETQMHLLSEELQKVKELEEIIQKNNQKLEELANAIALLKEQQQKEETTNLDEMEKELSPCLRLLPLETWTDIFGFLPRPQLAELVPQIGDWHFASKAQYYLHGCGRITLGELHICRSTSWITRKTGTPIVKLCNDYDDEHQYFGWDFPMADVPIPKNIINFEYIFIRYFNEFVLGFLQEFHRNSMLTNVDLSFYKTNVDSNAISQIVPLLTSIETLNLFYMDIEALIQKEYSARMLESARILLIYYKLDGDWYSRWLCTPREDGKPRVLILEPFAERSIFAFIEHIKKDFMDSNEAVSFFIHFRNFPNANNVQSDSLKNSKTSERLVINWDDQKFCPVTIARCPMQATDEFIEEMGKELDYDARNIRIEI